MSCYYEIIEKWVDQQVQSYTIVTFVEHFHEDDF